MVKFLSCLLFLGWVAARGQASSGSAPTGSAPAGSAPAKHRPAISPGCAIASTINLAAPTSEHIGGYDFANRACAPAEVIVVYQQAADPAKKIHIFIWDTDETVLSQPRARLYAPQVKAVAGAVRGMIANGRFFDSAAAAGNAAALAAGHKRPTIQKIDGFEAGVSIVNEDPENVGGLYLFVNDRYAIQIEMEHYGALGNDNREVVKLLQPFAEAIALGTLIK
jgi:hypothetical protein